MVYQGTVLGPILWILFFADVKLSINQLKFIEMIFADDINAYRTFDTCRDNKKIIQTLKNANSGCMNGAEQIK